MFSGGIITSKPVFFIFLSIGIVLFGIFLVFNYTWILNILTHGSIAGPCVWPADYVAMGGDMDELAWSEKLECYVGYI